MALRSGTSAGPSGQTGVRECSRLSSAPPAVVKRGTSGKKRTRSPPVDDMMMIRKSEVQAFWKDKESYTGKHNADLKKQRATQRRARFQVPDKEAPLRAQSGLKSLLEPNYPREATRRDYSRRLDKLWAFGRAHGFNGILPEELDVLLIDYCDYMHLEGEQIDAGTRLKAALEDWDPHLGVKGEKKLPRFNRCLKAWAAAGPMRARRALPFLVVAGLVGALMKGGFRETALRVLLLFTAYLRPSESSLKKCELIPPVKGGSIEMTCYAVLLRPQELGLVRKCGTFDDTIVLDDKRFSFLGPALELLGHRKRKEATLFADELPAVRRHIEWARRAINLKQEVSLHQLRHSGASHDAATGSREMLSIKKRGGWSSDSSLLRYQKHGQLQAFVHSLSEDTRAWCEFCDKNLEGLVRGSSLPRQPKLPNSAVDLC